MVRRVEPPQSHIDNAIHHFRGVGLEAAGNRTDPWACYYGDPSNHFDSTGTWTGEARCICGYCRDGLDCCESTINRKACGHYLKKACACIKYRSEPISEEMAERLVMIEREDPDYDYIDGVPS